MATYNFDLIWGTTGTLYSQGTSYTHGDLAFTTGYYSPNDGGGGWFRWNNSSNQDNNYGTIINPTGNSVNGRWLRLFDEGFINVRWFGAQGTTELNLRLQNALNVGAGRYVFVPLGTYQIVKNLELLSGTRFEGAGRGSIIKCAANFASELPSKAMVQIADGLDGISRQGEVRSLRLDASDSEGNPKAEVCLYVKGVYWHFERLWCVNAHNGAATGTAVVLDRTQNSKFVSCEFSDSDICCRVANGSGWTSFDRVEFRGAKTHHLVIDADPCLPEYQATCDCGECECECEAVRDSEDPCLWTCECDPECGCECVPVSYQNESTGITFQTCIFEETDGNEMDYQILVGEAERCHWIGCNISGGPAAGGPLLGNMYFQHPGGDLRNSDHVIDMCSINMPNHSEGDPPVYAKSIVNESNWLIVRHSFFLANDDPAPILMDTSGLCQWYGNNCTNNDYILKSSADGQLQVSAERLAGDTAQRPEHSINGYRPPFWNLSLDKLQYRRPGETDWDQLAFISPDGFLQVPSRSSLPTGSWTSYSGYKAVFFRTTDNKLYADIGGTWTPLW